MVVSLAPASIKKEGPTFDVAIALSYLLANKDISFDPRGKIFVGELSLDGAVRSSRGVLIAARDAKRAGYTELFVPRENAEEAALIRGIAVFPVSTLRELILHITGVSPIARQKETDPRVFSSDAKETLIDFADVRGQESRKTRA